MSTPTILITGGCSYSQIPNADVAWPLPLQESLGVRYVAHTGHGAAGNQLISRKVISKVIEAIELGHKPEDMIVGIMWSGCDRHSHYSENLDKNHSKTRILGFGGSYQEMLFAHTYNTPPAAIIDLENFNGEMDQHQNHSNPLSIRNYKNPSHYLMNCHWDDDLTNYYYEYFVNPQKAIIETCEHILRTEWFLKQKGIKYFFTEYDHDVFHYAGPFGYGGDPSEHPGHSFSPGKQWNGEIYSSDSECIQWPHHYTEEIDSQHLNNPEINYLYNAIDKDYFLPIKNLGQWAKEVSIHEFARKRDPHPSTEQHKEFVNKVILPFLLEKYNIQ
jgi:hypothetical protein